MSWSKLIAASIALMLLHDGLAIAQDFSDFFPADIGDAPAPMRYESFSYGNAINQRGSIVARKLPGAPLVIALPAHPAFTEVYKFGYGWLPSFLFDRGYAYASFGVRSDRKVAGAEFMARLAQGVAETIRQAEKRGFDVSA